MRILDVEKQIQLSLKIVDKVKEFKEKLGKGAVDEKFRSRTRQLYEFAFYSGSLPTMAYACSKAGIQCVKISFDYLQGARSITPEEVEDMSDEALSYGLYVASILLLLKESGIAIGGTDTKTFLRNILEVANRYPYVILRFMPWLKMIAESELKPEKT